MCLARSLVAVALAALCGHACAGFDNHSSFSTDTTTGLDWLDLSQTAGMSYLDAESGPFAAGGWRHATGQEVSDLFRVYTGKAERVWGSVAPEFGIELIRQLGVTFSTNNSEGVYAVYDSALPVSLLTGGMFNDEDPNQYVGIGQYVEYISCFGIPCVNDTTIWSVFRNEIGKTDINPAYGNFLVREAAAVPEPTSGALFLAGLVVFGIAGGKRYRATAKPLDGIAMRRQ